MTNTPPTPLRPAEVLLNLIIAFLTPMFVSVCEGNIALARQAAADTVNTYLARNPMDLLPIAQVIAFGLTTLSALSLSMGENLSINMIIRLRGNACALSRAGEQWRRVLEKAAPPEVPADAIPAYQPPAETPPQAAEPVDTATEDNLRAELTMTEQMLVELSQPDTARTNEQIYQETCAGSMIRVAWELLDDLPGRTQAARQEALVQVGALIDTARDLIAGNPPPLGALPPGWPGHA